MFAVVFSILLVRLSTSFPSSSRRSGMYKENRTKIHWYNDGDDVFVTLKDTETLYCFLEVYTRTHRNREYKKLKGSSATVGERDIETLGLVNKHLARLCQDSVLLTTENEWIYITNGAERMRRLIGSGKKNKKAKKKRRKKSTRKCPAKRTPQCSVLHEFHRKHIEYHNVNDQSLLRQVNRKACRCRHNTGTRIPCGSYMCYTNGIYQPCGVRYCENLVFDFCAESRTQCDPEKLLASYIVDSAV